MAVNNTKLAGFDLPKKMNTIEKLSGMKGGPDMEIQTLGGNVRVAPDLTIVQDMKLILPMIGELTGAGTVSPSNDLDFKMSATVHTSGLMSVVGNTPIPFTVQGTCADPIFRPDLKAVVKEKVKSVEGGLEKAAGGLIKGLLGEKKE